MELMIQDIDRLRINDGRSPIKQDRVFPQLHLVQYLIPLVPSTASSKHFQTFRQLRTSKSAQSLGREREHGSTSKLARKLNATPR
jgi:hypothetical protein